MTKVFAALIIAIIFTFPVLLAVVIIRAILKNSIKKIVLATVICVASILPLTLLGVITDPATWCEHQYEIVGEKAASCTVRGEINKRCTLCDKTSTEYTDKTPHQWSFESVCNASCVDEGYTIEKCTVCSDTRKVNVVGALGHAMEETYRLNPTPSTDGKVKSVCSRCNHEETSIFAKLENTNNENTKEHIQGKHFSFQFKGSTAASHVRKFCNYPGHTYIASTFRGTPNDLSYLDALRDHSDSDEILWGEYYTITATVAIADYNFNKTRINCFVRSNTIEVVFSVEFQEGFEDLIGEYTEGDVITFRGKFYDEGCGFTDSILL